MRGEFIDVGGCRLYYYAAGSRGQGDPILLIHGFPTTGHLWGDLVALLPRGHRIVVPDLLGCGRSDSDDAADLSIAGHATRLVRLMDTLGIARASLVGHHFGAAIAGCIATSHPSRITHLALLHPLGGDVTLTGTLALIRAFDPLSRLLPPAFLRRRIRQELLRWYGDAARGRLSVEQYVRALTGGARWRAFMSQLRAFDEREMLLCTISLAALRIPVAVVAGTADPAVPEEAVRELLGVLPQATLDIVRDVPHFSPEESPEQISRIIGRLLAT